MDPVGPVAAPEATLPPSRGRCGGTAWLAAVLAAALALVALPAAAAPAAATERPAANGVTAHGGAPHLGPDGAQALVAGVVDMAATRAGDGYWLVAGDGGVFSYGAASFHGSAGGIALNQPVVGMAAHPSGDGYWLVASDGGVFAYGAAGFHGSMGGVALNQPVVGIEATPAGDGYWLVASDGGVFAFGDATFHGSTGALTLNRPIVDMAASPSGDGYWLVASDGGVFAYGAAGFHGSTGDRPSGQPVVGIAASPGGGGYLLARRDGQVVGFGVDLPGGAGAGDVRQAPTVAIVAHPTGGHWLAHGAPSAAWGAGGLFPEHRVVAFYGSPASPVMGVLGEGRPQEVAQRLREQARPYEADGRRVIPAFELIATMALAAPGPSGLHNRPTPIAEVRPYLDAVRAVGGILILDIQPGRGDVLAEARRYDELLREPDVGLALDPEWNVGPDGRPGGGTVGSISAEEVNRVSDHLAGLVERFDLPEKLLVIHRFTPEMVTDEHLVVSRPGVALAFHADGIGSRAAKLADYHTLLPDRFARGIKLFYEADPALIPPEDLLRLEPPPDIVTYQ